MKISVVIPVYYNQNNLRPLYADISAKLLDQDKYEWEIVMVDDGSKDKSYDIMKELRYMVCQEILAHMRRSFAGCQSAQVIVQWSKQLIFRNRRR